MPPDQRPSRIAVLASGRGSNLQAIIEAIARGDLAAQLAGVFSDRPKCAALQRVPSHLCWAASPARFADKAAYEQALGDAIDQAGADWIVCAGYMRILGPELVRRFDGRLLNIHPSLLPKYRGLHTHAAALAAGDAEHGASVHFVSDALDAGPLIAQTAIAIHPGDTADTLAARLLPCEHHLLVAVLRLATAGRLRLLGQRVHVDGHALLHPLRLDCAGQWHPPLPSACNASL